MAVFVLPRGGEEAFFDLPWPTDLRRTPEGTLDVRDFPNPTHNRTLTGYIDAITGRIDGYSTAGSAYVRFSVPVDPETLPPTAAASLDPEASVFLVDVDPDSPTRGTRHPVAVHYREEPTIYWPANTVALRPVFGAPLSPATTYAAVVTSAVRPAGGGFYARDVDFDALVTGGGDAEVEVARAVIAPAIEEVEAAGTPTDEVISIAVFTTQDPTAEIFAARDWMVDSYAEPTAVDMRWRWVADEELYTRIEGAYGPAPIFQSGASPYRDSGSGDIVFEGGAPVVQDEFEARFALTVPRTPMPPDGYPIALVAHGTYGDYETFIDDGTAAEMASVGYAALGIDQVLHGDRNPTGEREDYLFFNFLNPYAARNNNRQAALDIVQQARFATSVEVPLRTINTGGDPVRFDPTKVFIFGHSQGGLNMPLFLAADDTARGGILSGAGGTLLISIIEKQEPVPIALAVQLFLVLPGATPEQALEREHFVYEHPVLSLLQGWIDASDGVNYARHLFHAPRDGFAPKSMLQVQGQNDAETSPNAGHSLAAAARIPIVRRVAVRIEALDLAGIDSVVAPVTGNVGDGAATAGLIQVPDQGHFAIFDDEAVKARARRFMGSFDDGVPTILP